MKPSIASPVETFTVWRWRNDCERWTRVSQQPTIEKARARRDKEVEALRLRPTGVSRETRITHDVTTREEVVL